MNKEQATKHMKAIREIMQSKKPRKPHDFKSELIIASAINANLDINVDGSLYYLSPQEVRKLSTWLLKAADYLDYLESKK